MPVTPCVVEALKLLLYIAHTKAIALALSPPEYAKNMHENLDEVCIVALMFRQGQHPWKLLRRYPHG